MILYLTSYFAEFNGAEMVEFKTAIRARRCRAAQSAAGLPLWRNRQLAGKRSANENGRAGCLIFVLDIGWFGFDAAQPTISRNKS